MAIELNYFKTYEIKQYSKGDYELVTSEEELDEVHTFADYWEAQEIAERIGLGEIFTKAIPYVRSFPIYMDEAEKNKIERLLISPAECLALNEKYNLIPRLLQETTEHEISLQSVLNNWKKGRYCVVHYE